MPCTKGLYSIHTAAHYYVTSRGSNKGGPDRMLIVLQERSWSKKEVARCRKKRLETVAMVSK